MLPPSVESRTKDPASLMPTSPPAVWQSAVAAHGIDENRSGTRDATHGSADSTNRISPPPVRARNAPPIRSA